MNKNIFALTAFLLVSVAFFSTLVYAGSSSSSTLSSAFDVSIDRVKVNGRVVADSRTNIIADADVFSVLVDITAVETLQKGHVEAILRGRQTGDVVSDSTGTFDLNKNQSSAVALTLVLIDKLKREDEFDLTIKVVNALGNSEQKTFGIKTNQRISGRQLDVSIDRVKVNAKVVAQSRTNFIDRSNDFDVAVEFTALEDLQDAHVEAILRDLESGTVIADATPNFNLAQDLSSSKLLRLELLDKLKLSNSFELAVKIVDAEGDSIQQIYGLTMRERNGVAGLTGVAGGRALDVSIDSIELENKVLAENENTFVLLDKSKKTLNLKVRLTSLENVQDAHVDAVLAFENGIVVSDATTTFDIIKGQNLIKDLDLPVISNFEQNSFKLKVRVVDAEGNVEEKFYALEISHKKFPFVISSIALSPENSVEAGKNLIAKLSFKNSGVVPLEGITAKVSIPELGISSTKFIDQIKNSELSEVSEDFVLKILDNVATGTYTVRSEIASQFGGDSEVKEIPVYVLGRSDQLIQVVNEKLVIKIPIVIQDINNDGSEVIYPITLRNDGPDANAYALLLDGSNWASLRLAESNTFVIKPRESKTIYVYASSKANFIGEQIFVATIKSNDKVLKQIPLKGNVIAAAHKSLLAARLKNVLEIMLILFVVFLVVAGLFFGFRKYSQKDEELADEEYYNRELSEEIPDKGNGETYY